MIRTAFVRAALVAGLLSSSGVVAGPAALAAAQVTTADAAPFVGAINKWR
jgi:hypothetical protein